MTMHSLKIQPKNLPAVFKAMRKALKMSQRDLAEYLGCWASAVSHYETGKRKIPLDVLEEMGELLGFEMYVYFLRKE